MVSVQRLCVVAEINTVNALTVSLDRPGRSWGMLADLSSDLLAF